MKNNSLGILIILLLIITSSCQKGIRFQISDPSPQSDFGRSYILQKYELKQVNYKIEMALNDALSEQAFSIKSTKKTIRIEGGNHTGLMYGAIELGDLIALGYDLHNLDLQKTPFHKDRGIKLNIPLDARCPSYDDSGDAAQKNIEHMWDYKFWTEYLDKLAIYRYNTLSLWTPNPFQVMTKLPDYPDLALDDVYVTKAIPKGTVMEWDEPGGVNKLVTNDMRFVKSISIDDKIKFWQKVFDYAKARGINVYLYTWNIYTNGTEGKYGLTEEIDNPKTIAYYRQAINVFLQTYPQIKGIGITAGERMHVAKNEDVADKREKWLWDTYGEGILDYKKTDPNREIRFIHRIWYSRFDQIMKYWKNYPDQFEVGYKYVKARIYSSPKTSPFVGGLTKSLKENNLKCWWNLRNDDIFVYRWGDPDYTREFLKNLPKGTTAGYHMGPDGYVFARVFSDKDKSVNGTLELDKHWFKFMLWGRLGYDNSLDNDFFKRQLASRFPTVNSELLFETWQTASKIIPQINRYMFFTGDRHWAPELCASRESFKYTTYFRIAKPMPGNNILNPKRFAQKSDENNINDHDVTPLMIIDNLNIWSDKVLKQLAEIGDDSKSIELLKADLEAFAWLGKYYASKIQAALILETTVGIDKPNGLEKTMKNATQYWTNYANVSDENYYPQMYSRVTTLDWKAMIKDVKRDEELIINSRTKHSLTNKLEIRDNKLSVFYPYKDDGRWVRLNSDTKGLAKLFLYDDRNELLDFYAHQCETGKSTLIWEDLSWLSKGNYTLVFEIDGKTSHYNFIK